jgi:hypothetical protein
MVFYQHGPLGRASCARVDSADPCSIGGCTRQRGKISHNIYIYIYLIGFINGDNFLSCMRVHQESWSTVRNKAAPGGCIAVGYIATELLTFCSRYLNNAPTFHNRPQRNHDGSKGAGTRVTLNRLAMHQIHRYIVFNSEKFHNLRM